MDQPIFVVGHKNPDTDSICSAIAYSNFKNKSGYHTLPCRAGNINDETRYVLEFFGVEEPQLLPDLHTRARDLINGMEFTTVNPEVPVWTAWKTMRALGIKTLPVVDRRGSLQGVVTVGDFADKYLAGLEERDLGHVRGTVGNVAKTLSGELLTGDSERVLKGPGIVGVMRAESRGNCFCADSVVIVGDREDIQRAALKAGAACLILTSNTQPTDSVREEATGRKVALISTEFDAFTAARMVLMSIPVESIMHSRDLVVFNEDDLLDEVKKVMLNTRFRNYPVVDDQNRVLGEISRYHILSFARKKVILVDHNEFSQSVDGAEEAQIIEIIDHHRVGGIQTGDPILFRNEPVGSTCTLVAKAYLEAGIMPEAKIAGILCAGILSDTVIFKSPTCTNVDKDMAAYLGEIAGIDPLQFGVAMFKHSTSLLGRTPEDILGTDFKKFKMGEVDIGIGQVGVMGSEEIGQMKPELLNEMDRVRKVGNYAYVLLMVTDLLTDNTHLLINGKKPEDIGRAFNAKVQENQVLLENVLSRKKQVVPPLNKFFQQ